MKVGGRKKGLKIVEVVGFVGVEEWGEKRGGGRKGEKNLGFELEVGILK